HPPPPPSPHPSHPGGPSSPRADPAARAPAGMVTCLRNTTQWGRNKRPLAAWVLSCPLAFSPCRCASSSSTSTPRSERCMHLTSPSPTLLGTRGHWSPATGTVLDIGIVDRGIV